jgi:hypothetical protein
LPRPPGGSRDVLTKHGVDLPDGELS